MKLKLSPLLLFCLLVPALLNANTDDSLRIMAGKSTGVSHQFKLPALLQINSADSSVVFNTHGFRMQSEGTKGKLIRQHKDSLIFRMECGFEHYTHNPEMDWTANLGVMDPMERSQAKPPHFRAGGDTLYIGFRLFHATLPDTFIVHLSDTEKLIYTAKNYIVNYTTADSSMGEVKLSLKGKKPGNFRTYKANEFHFYCMLEFRMPHNGQMGEFLMMRGEEFGLEIIGRNTATSFLLRKENLYQGNLWLMARSNFYMSWQLEMVAEKP
ncbi:MAG: hypothetical protein MUC87_01440 [Bacteroidia bacterium]|nr:hypothetical protein [Bacteroidia bacterium]